MAKRFVDEDMVRIKGDWFDRFRRETKSGRVVQILYWGDEIDLVDPAENDDPDVRDLRVTYYDYASGRFADGTVRKRRAGGRNLPVRLLADGAPRPLAVSFIDVQQGDATLIRTPAGRHLLVDGGEEVFIARLLASLFPGTSADEPLLLDALVITHGDADHFEGLTALAGAADQATPRKRIHCRLARYLHNGLVKSPEKVPDGQGGRRTLKERERFGESVPDGGEDYAVELHQDPRQAALPNEPFAEWNAALPRLVADPAHLAGAPRVPGEALPVIRRVEAGDDEALGVFAGEGLHFEVLGPVTDTVDGRPALEVLRDEDGDQSASHTINGHSVILRLRHGRVRFLLGGDLNVHGAEKVLHWVGANGRDLESEVLKVPHHGSHEYSDAFLAAVGPVVSVVSSGDENAAKEYVHPRANLMAALGRHSRGPEPLLFCTELAAFFTYRGGIQPEDHRTAANDQLEPLPEGDRRGFFFAFERLRFGVVRVRTDGERVFVAPESASDRIKEAYAFTVGDDGAIRMTEPRIV
jgi:beta-lactamase superfamily II metal-dependent hydrolase